MYYNCHFNLYKGVKVMLKSQEKLVHFLFSEAGNSYNLCKSTSSTVIISSIEKV